MQTGATLQICDFPNCQRKIMVLSENDIGGNWRQKKEHKLLIVVGIFLAIFWLETAWAEAHPTVILRFYAISQPVDD